MAAIFGNSKTSMLYPLNTVDAITLWHNECTVVSQIFEQAENGTLLPHINLVLQQQLSQYLLLIHKDKTMIESLQKMKLKDTKVSDQTILNVKLASTKNVSSINNKNPKRKIG